MQLSERDIKKLNTVHPDLQKVIYRAAEITEVDFVITCGIRTLEEQAELYAQGRTKPGKIVTWTMKSRHLPAADGFGRAVDLVPYPIDWNTTSKFDAIASAVMQASNELNIPIRWGADWDKDGVIREKGETDSPHFELC